MVARAAAIPSNGALLLGMLHSWFSIRKPRTRVVVLQTHSRTGALLLGMLVFADLESILVLPGVLIIPLINHMLLLGMLDLHPCVGVFRECHVLTCHVKPVHQCHLLTSEVNKDVHAGNAWQNQNTAVTWSERINQRDGHTWHAGCFSECRHLLTPEALAAVLRMVMLDIQGSGSSRTLLLLGLRQLLVKHWDGHTWHAGCFSDCHLLTWHHCHLLTVDANKGGHTGQSSQQENTVTWSERINTKAVGW